jgi:hypothetical protein
VNVGQWPSLQVTVPGNGKFENQSLPHAHRVMEECRGTGIKNACLDLGLRTQTAELLWHLRIHVNLQCKSFLSTFPIKQVICEEP